MFKISQILKKLAKKYLNIIILAILFSMSCWANPKTLSSAESDDLVSINFYQTDIAIILQALADNKQMNLVMVDDLSTKQTIKLQNVTWQKALTVVLNSANLRAEIDDNILFISKADDPEELLQKKLLEQKELQLNEPLTLLTIPVNHADLSNLVETIQSQGLLSERGKAIIDKRTNSIIITDMSKQFSNIKKLVKSLDQPIPQVHISAHIVTMNKQSKS